MSARSKKLGVVVLSLSAVALVAWPVYAHCGRCAVDGKAMLKVMAEGDMTLAKAVELAEGHAKGKALMAYAEVDDGEVEIEVVCQVGDGFMEVEINPKTGKVVEAESMQRLPKVMDDDDGMGKDDHDHGHDHDD